jgi:hypothetical protein
MTSLETVKHLVTTRAQLVIMTPHRCDRAAIGISATQFRVRCFYCFHLISAWRGLVHVGGGHNGPLMLTNAHYFGLFCF